MGMRTVRPPPRCKRVLPVLGDDSRNLLVSWVCSVHPWAGRATEHECLCLKVPVALWQSWHWLEASKFGNFAFLAWGHWPPLMAEVRYPLHLAVH